MKKNVKIIGAIAIVVLAALLIILILMQKSANKAGNNNNAQTPSKEMLETQTPEAAQETQKLINDVTSTEGASSTKTITVNVPGVNGASSTVKEIKVVTVAPGTSPIDVTSGKVVTEAGQVVQNNSQAAGAAAPQESFPIKPEDAPKSAIKLNVTSSSFAPNTFTVNRGQVVNLAVSNVNESTFSEVFRFDDPSLSAVVIGLAKGQTISISFNAPTKAGEYTFYSSMFDHRAQGAVGKMIVK